eukprot:2886485-Rhodomonas_salina.1
MPQQLAAPHSHRCASLSTTLVSACCKRRHGVGVAGSKGRLVDESWCETRREWSVRLRKLWACLASSSCMHGPTDTREQSHKTTPGGRAAGERWEGRQWRGRGGQHAQACQWPAQLQPRSLYFHAHPQTAAPHHSPHHVGLRSRGPGPAVARGCGGEAGGAAGRAGA